MRSKMRDSEEENVVRVNYTGYRREGIRVRWIRTPTVEYIFTGLETRDLS